MNARRIPNATATAPPSFVAPPQQLTKSGKRTCTSAVSALVSDRFHCDYISTMQLAKRFGEARPFRLRGAER
jgi:hypothetical protein